MTERERKIKIQTLDEIWLFMHVLYMTNEERENLLNLIEIRKKAEEGINDRRKKKSNSAQDRECS